MKGSIPGTVCHETLLSVIESLPPAPRSALDDNPVDAAFDEWFNSATPAGSIDVDPLPAPPGSQSLEAMQPQPPAPTMPNLAPSGDTAGDSEDDDDLEMFRSWLQSLKK